MEKPKKGKPDPVDDSIQIMAGEVRAPPEPLDGGNLLVHEYQRMDIHLMIEVIKNRLKLDDLLRFTDFISKGFLNVAMACHPDPDRPPSFLVRCRCRPGRRPCRGMLDCDIDLETEATPQPPPVKGGGVGGRAKKAVGKTPLLKEDPRRVISPAGDRC